MNGREDQWMVKVYYQGDKNVFNFKTSTLYYKFHDEYLTVDIIMSAIRTQRKLLLLAS